MLGAAAACRSNAVAILENPDHCFILVAALQPAASLLDIGDTLTIRSQTVAASGSLCWNTALADSVQYSALVYFPTAASGIQSPRTWVTHRALATTHTWIITVTTTAPSTPTVLVQGVTPDRGC